MTQLIADQLGAMGLMACSGMAAGIVYEFFSRLKKMMEKIRLPGVFAGAVEITGLLLIGWCSSVFFYYSNGGKITMQGIACFFIGLLIWRKLIYTEDGVKEYGQEGNQTAGIREEPQGVGYYRGTRGTKEEKKKKPERCKDYRRRSIRRR